MALSNIGIVVDFNGDRPDRFGARLERALALTGADRCSRWENAHPGRASVALVHSAVSTLPEDHGPAGNRTGQRLAVLADVRLDNRGDLLAALGDAGSSMSDEAIVAAALDAWGSRCMRRFVGDFAVIAWDPDQEVLVAQRDVFGVRALLWAYEDSRLVVASTVAGVRAGLRRPATHNRQFLRRWIDRTPQGLTSATAFNEISWLPPGHQLTVSRGRAAVTAVDTVRAATSGTPRTALDAAHQFRDLLTRAVEVRLRSSSPVGFRVSGGFDSSAILCLADRAAAEGRCPVPLRSYSATFSRNKKADERHYLSAVLERCPHVTPTLLPWDDRPWSVDLIGDEDGFPMDEPPDSSRFAAVPQSQIAVGDGCRVIHEGTWADQLLLRWPYGHPTLLWDLPLRVAAHEFRHFRESGMLRMAQSVPAGLWRRFRRVGAAAGVNAMPESALSTLISRQFRLGNTGMVMSAKDRRARFLGAEFRYPYLDRALHEFVMALPPQFLFHRGSIKQLQREGLSGILPDAFRTRQTFGAMTHLLIEGACRDRDRIAARLASPLVVESGLVSAERVRTLIGQITPTMRAWVTVDLQRVLSVEAWLRHEAKRSQLQTNQ